jgi:hypothetical protein
LRNYFLPLAFSGKRVLFVRPGKVDMVRTLTKAGKEKARPLKGRAKSLCGTRYKKVVVDRQKKIVLPGAD